MSRKSRDQEMSFNMVRCDYRTASNLLGPIGLASLGVASIVGSIVMSVATILFVLAGVGCVIAAARFLGDYLNARIELDDERIVVVDWQGRCRTWTLSEVRGFKRDQLTRTDVERVGPDSAATIGVSGFRLDFSDGAVVKVSNSIRNFDDLYVRLSLVAQHARHQS